MSASAAKLLDRLRFVRVQPRGIVDIENLGLQDVRRIRVITHNRPFFMRKSRPRILRGFDQLQDCGAKLERLSWLEGYSRVTRRLANSAARLCAVMSIRHAAPFYRLAWTTVKRIDFRHLQREREPVQLGPVRVNGMDEFAIQKGHRYATVVVEPSRKRVLWVGRGRGREDVRPFFELLGVEGYGQVQAAVMDMNAGYAEEVRSRCPQAAIVYDLFHVVAKYGREVIDRVRVDEPNRLRQDRPARHWVKCGNRDLIWHPVSDGS